MSRSSFENLNGNINNKNLKDKKTENQEIENNRLPSKILNFEESVVISNYEAS